MKREWCLRTQLGRGWIAGIGLTLMFLNVPGINAAITVPDLRGTWITGHSSGSETGCIDPDDDDSFSDPGGDPFTISQQIGNNFSGTVTFSESEGGFTLTETTTFSGTVMPDGTFSASGMYIAIVNPGNLFWYSGNINISGSISGNTLNIMSTWMDTAGDTCTGSDSGTATRSGTIPPPIIIGMNDPYDVNGDGRADLVWRNMTNGGTMVWQMTAGALRGPITFPGGVATNWEIKGVGDINGDGHADLVWRNTTNGGTMVWQMTAGALRGPITFPGGVALNWEIQ